MLSLSSESFQNTVVVRSLMHICSKTMCLPKYEIWKTDKAVFVSLKNKYVWTFYMNSGEHKRTNERNPTIWHDHAWLWQV